MLLVTSNQADVAIRYEIGKILAHIKSLQRRHAYILSVPCLFTKAISQRVNWISIPTPNRLWICCYVHPKLDTLICTPCTMVLW